MTGDGTVVDEDGDGNGENGRCFAPLVRSGGSIEEVTWFNSFLVSWGVCRLGKKASQYWNNCEEDTPRVCLVLDLHLQIPMLEFTIHPSVGIFCVGISEQTRDRAGVCGLAFWVRCLG